MKTFLSWSGDKSHKIAKEFNTWIPCVVQAVEPWLSSRDIDRGSIWFNEILEQLRGTNFGIVFVTKENQGKPWLLFESGALSKGLTENRVCTVLVDLSVRDIDPASPLQHLNHTQIEKESVLGLVKTINNQIEEGAIKEEHLEKSFAALWDDFETKVKAILAEEPASKEPERKDPDVLDNILNHVLNIRRTVSRTGSRIHEQHVARRHAELLIKRLLKMDYEREVIEEIAEDIVPEGWLDKELNHVFGCGPEDFD